MKIFNFKQAKLKHQLTILIAFSILMILTVEIFYYLSISVIIRNRTEVYTENLLTQVSDKLNNISEQINQSADLLSYNKYTQRLLIEENHLKRYELNQIVQDLMSYIRATNSNINNLIIIDSNKRLINSIIIPTDILKELNTYYDIFVSDSQKASLSKVIRDNQEKVYYYSYSTPVYLSLESSDSRKLIGVCTVLCRIDMLYNAIAKISTTENSIFLIIDSNDMVVATNKTTDLIGKVISNDISELFDSSVKQQKSTGKYSFKNSLIQYRDIEGMGLRVISIIPLSEIKNELTPTKKYGLIIAYIASILLILLGIIFNLNVTRPIAYIMDFMNNTSSKNLHHRLEIKESNEIGQIAVNVNNMLDEIEKMTKKIITTQSSLYEMELAKKQAELSALQSQINPHFLYNTLDCIQGIGFAYKSKEIVSITSSLSKIFRYSIKAGDIVYIKNELECIKDYMNIISIRFGGRYISSIKIEDDLMEMKTLKFILQPIVENAVYHGLEHKYGNGFVKIEGYLKENGNIVFEVHDNGIGMNELAVKELNHKLNKQCKQGFLAESENRSIGLINISSRIKHVFGKEYGIEILSKENEGTVVIIEVPQIKN